MWPAHSTFDSCNAMSRHCLRLIMKCKTKKTDYVDSKVRLCLYSVHCLSLLILLTKYVMTNYL